MALPTSGKSYTELPDVEEFTDDDEIFLLNNGYGEKAKVSDFIDDLQSRGTGTNMISDAFDEEMNYSAGDYCIYENDLYKFTEDKEAGEWDDSVVEITTVSGEIKENTDLIDSLLIVKSFTSDIITQSSATNGTIAYENITIDGYTPLGILGVQFSNGSSGVNSSWVFSYNWALTSSTRAQVLYRTTNTNSTFICTIYMLYQKN